MQIGTWMGSCFHFHVVCAHDKFSYLFFLSLRIICITVNSLYSYFEWGIESFDDIETNNNIISRKNLVDHALELCHILKYEFILSPVSLFITLSTFAWS
jgi:hypothetical protein